MAWYYGTYKCGHEGRTNIVGPTKNRDWISEKRFSGLCPECYEKERLEKIEKENAQAAEKASSYELPELIGTEKQVLWANTLRVKMIDKLTDMIEHSKNVENMKDAQLIEDVQTYLISEKLNASWYIDVRYYLDNKIISDLLSEYKNSKKKDDADLGTKDIKVESTISPVEIKHTGIVEITGHDNNINVKYEKNEDFRQIVKSLGFTWNGTWSRRLSETTGSFTDRAAELGNKLLQEGFRICIYDENIQQKAINADFEPECKRWIYRRRDTDKLALNWSREEPNSDTIYENSRKILTSKWDSPSVVVDISHYEEVQDFAEMYNFKFTKSAMELIKDYENKLASINEVVPAEPVKIEEEDKLEKILNSSREVLGDLIDED